MQTDHVVALLSAIGRDGAPASHRVREDEAAHIMLISDLSLPHDHFIMTCQIQGVIE